MGSQGASGRLSDDWKHVPLAVRENPSPRPRLAGIDEEVQSAGNAMTCRCPPFLDKKEVLVAGTSCRRDPTAALTASRSPLGRTTTWTCHTQATEVASGDAAGVSS